MKKNSFVVLVIFLFINSGLAWAKSNDASVVIIVDTSVSMKEAGMDPQRVSLLVSKLLSDVIPGNLSYVRLLDLGADASLLPTKRTGREIPCGEDASKTCNEVQFIGDVGKAAYNQKFGLIERATRGDNSFKVKLETHLDQVSNNSPFDLAFSSARGWLQENSSSTKHIVWLSDGKTDNDNRLLKEIANAKAEDIVIEAIVFGGGDTSIAKKANLPVVQTKNPADLMKAFSDVFRKIVHAPYDIDNTVAAKPRFKMLPNMKEAWVVVYGDDSLTDVSLVKPDGSNITADYAKDNWSGAGAYKVGFIEMPEEGEWEVKVQGGGKGVAYAVVQNSSLYPFLEEPAKTSLGVETLLVARIKAGGTNDLVKDSNLLSQSKITALIDSKVYLLNDEGTDGDKQAKDGLYSGKVAFTNEGENEVKLTLTNNFTDKTVSYSVSASGFFESLSATASEIDFGTLTHDSEACKEITLNAKQKGVLEFELEPIDSLPTEHQLTASTRSGDSKLLLKPGESFKICLKTGKTAPSSIKQQEELFLIKLSGSNTEKQQVRYKVSWEVNGLSFFQRWLWLLLIIAGLIVATIIALGFILPQRFQSTLHVSMGADLEELDEFVPMQLKRMPNVGIGFYRNAQAFIHDDFRVSGKAKGASVAVKAGKSEVTISGVNGRVVQRMNAQLEWEGIGEGLSLRSGEVLRISDTGLYFKLLDM